MASYGASSSSAAAENPWTPPYCSVVAVDTSAFCYRVCSICERTLSDTASNCPVCSRRIPNAGSKHVYRLLVSVGTVDRVMVVVCFDRVARVLMGCSADDWTDFLGAHPSAREKVGELLQGEMLRMTLSRSRKGNAEHLRVASVVPLRAGFRPVIDRLRRLYGVEAGAPSSGHRGC
ncbi:uncharacterized protein LOC103994548 [Musa acuminata AAA Group]|uniref:Replication factor A C-terminal domain-containing protein n=1 Tax=Musa acuminata subsp. malaccensis TaxID=214687 RepID=A0A804K623_MUSAM|nr:PREDICTED: uncharacterized protein LOC103994548 isoform X2 [Musa acuminata subsp. malaccensis]